jgi:hypothetical protein
MARRSASRRGRAEGRVRRCVGTVTGALLLTAAVGPLPSASWPSSSIQPKELSECNLARQPFHSVPGAEMTAAEHVSKDAEPVRYVLWSGFVPSFDGLPMSVDVTVPCGSPGVRPALTMLHGFTDDKTVWEETGKSDTGASVGRPGSNSHWNNIWFASRGYVTLTYTARGWRDSCGPDAPGASVGSPSARCAEFAYWIHLDDARWEVRDAQWLTAALVEGGLADPERLGITGGSYGGAPTAMAALLDDHVMCGADAVPAALGPDPCDGRRSGELAPWTTPDGTRRLHWAAAVPMYTFSDLLEVLAPNGRGSDGMGHAPDDGSHDEPVGVPLASTIDGLLLAGSLTGFFAPPGRDPESDIVAMTGRLLAGPPYSTEDPMVALGVEVSERYRSPISIAPRGRVPIFWVQGHTDALFPANQATQFLAAVREKVPDYPIKVFLGDIGHDYAAERQDEWDLVKRQMNEFVDHELRPDRTPSKPAYDVRSTIARCLAPDAPMRSVAASTWSGLQQESRTLTSSADGRTATTDVGPAGLATDPISTATIGADSYKGCRVMRPSSPDPTTATYLFPLDREMVVIGGPVVEVTFDSPGQSLPLAVRVWDVTEDGSAQGLVTRGVFRTDDAPGDGRVARFQLATAGYRFAAGHTVKVEVTGNDEPYLLANREPVEIAVNGLELIMPLHVTPSRAAPVPGAQSGESGLPIAVYGLLFLAGLVGLGLVTIGIRRRRRP